MDDIIKKIVDKISSYEIFSNFIPGILFCNLLNLTTRFKMPDELWEKLAFYYFGGMIVGRIGSLCIEGFFKWWPLCKDKKILEFAPYKSYVMASKIDDKIDILNQKKIYIAHCVQYF